MDKKQANIRKNAFYKYDETTLLFINLIIIFLFLFDISMRLDVVSFVLSFEKSAIFFPVALAGFLSAFYLVLFRTTNRWFKMFAGFYIILINLFIGTAGIFYLAENDAALYMMIFPLTNVISSMIMLFAIRYNIVRPSELIIDKEIEKREFVVGASLIPVIILASVYILKNYWIETFSICLFYVTVVNNFAIKTIPHTRNKNISIFSRAYDNKAYKISVAVILLLIFITVMFFQSKYRTVL